ncbi:MAG: hypothetical protein WBD07_03005 [Vicinamibacterales bacterium]
MRNRFLAAIVTAAVGALVPLAASLGAGQNPPAAPAAGQGAGRGAAPIVNDGTPVPRTPDGRADLSGVWNKRLVQNTAAAVQPLPFTAAGLKAFNDVWNHIDPTSKCVLPGVPRVNTSPYPFQIVQTPDKVIFLYEYMHNFRVIYTDNRPHNKNFEPSLLGDSVGRWEGDTLVIDTTNLTDRTWLDDHGNRHSDALHVIERWRRVSANQLSYEETIDDPKFYTRPWTVGWLMPLAPKDWVIMEYACTDNNKDMTDGHLQNGPLNGSLRDGTAVAPAAPARGAAPATAPAVRP